MEVETEGKELTVVVEDYGVGIRDVEKAMEPMFTTDKTGTRSGMGFSFMGGLLWIRCMWNRSLEKGRRLS